MNIALFSGSFNPIHVGHLVLANYVCECTDIDEVWLMVSPQNPLKMDASLLPDELRLKWAMQAVGNHSRIKVSDFEFSLPRPSYTIDTLTALQQLYPNHSFTLLIGADNWESFHLWRSYTTILSEFSIMVYPRVGSFIAIADEWKGNVQSIDAPLVEISSTFIRNAVKQSKDVRFFLPSGVDYQEVVNSITEYCCPIKLLS